ncbi:heme ABC transporter ATP-binding protein [Streptomyces sp. TP-A0874]|uniref:heme ABC transporter ATP-binding protein n=1 Tax=Streptomyces sp. TP-A0874 TaxID=549819 RepID=UPI000853195D|nr:heme ABC transporter ATP-binding protein [Streptomyces sp. TP-A0874]
MIGTLFGRLRPPRVPEPVPAGRPLAEARGLRVRLGGRTVLEDASLQAVAGQVLALVGPNGAGKSTLLAALAADLVPDGGTVLTAGRPAAEWSAVELSRRRAVLPQSPTLSFPFTVEEVVRMGRAPWHGTSAEDEDDDAVATALAVTETAGFAQRSFAALSGGERARVALARVLAQRVPLMLLDEPTAALDLRHQELVLRNCRERARAGDAVVVVLHDLGSAAAYADRVAVLHGGRIAAEGPPSEVYRESLLSEVYRQPLEVIAHPRTGEPLVVPRREADGGGDPVRSRATSAR